MVYLQNLSGLLGMCRKSPFSSNKEFAEFLINFSFLTDSLIFVEDS